jgi:alkanesulfonate monooxygenase SsuD/methylene tetrahydromethanopterin reductase-like flavin-dependent oxidoreductase (luciferase family)
MPQPNDLSRVERLTEAVTVMKGLLRGERVSFAGQHYRVTGHTIARLPVQKPHPPVLIGSNGSRIEVQAFRLGEASSDESEVALRGSSPITYSLGRNQCEIGSVCAG